MSLMVSPTVNQAVKKGHGVSMDSKNKASITEYAGEGVSINNPWTLSNAFIGFVVMFI